MEEYGREIVLLIISGVDAEKRLNSPGVIESNRIIDYEWIQAIRLVIWLIRLMDMQVGRSSRVRRPEGGHTGAKFEAKNGICNVALCLQTYQPHSCHIC